MQFQHTKKQFWQSVKYLKNILRSHNCLERLPWVKVLKIDVFSVAFWDGSSRDVAVRQPRYICHISWPAGPVTALIEKNSVKKDVFQVVFGRG